MKLTIHTDGGSRGNPGPAAIGVVVQDGDRVVTTIAKYVGETTNNVAEYRAVVEALHHLQSQTFSIESVEFYLDSLLVVQQLNKKFAIKKAELLQFAQEIWSIVASLPFPVAFSHVPREQNTQADLLVNQALDEEQRGKKSQD